MRDLVEVYLVPRNPSQSGFSFLTARVLRVCFLPEPSGLYLAVLKGTEVSQVAKLAVPRTPALSLAWDSGPHEASSPGGPEGPEAGEESSPGPQELPRVYLAPLCVASIKAPGH